MNIFTWLFGIFTPALEAIDELEQMFTISKDREPEPGWADGMPQEYTGEEE